MHIDVKAKTEDDEVIFEGKLNKNEVSFLLGFAINDLVAAGVQFYLDQEQDEDDDDAPVRIGSPKDGLN